MSWYQLVQRVAQQCRGDVGNPELANPPPIRCPRLTVELGVPRAPGNNP